VTDLLPWAFGVRLAALALSLALAARPQWCRRLAFTGSILASALTGAAGLAVVLGGTPLRGVLWSHAASGFAFAYALAPLSAWFLLVLAALAIPAALYSTGYLPHALPPARVAFVAAPSGVLTDSVRGGDARLAALVAWAGCVAAAPRTSAWSCPTGTDAAAFVLASSRDPRRSRRCSPATWRPEGCGPVVFFIGLASGGPAPCA
jgi:hypothetical protein